MVKRVAGKKVLLNIASAQSAIMVDCLSGPSVLQLSPALNLVGEHRCAVLLLLIPH